MYVSVWVIHIDELNESLKFQQDLFLNENFKNDNAVKFRYILSEKYGILTFNKRNAFNIYWM